MANADFGLIGLGTMGASLARNINSRGFVVSTFNRSYEKTSAFIDNFGSDSLLGFENLKDFIQSLAKPRKILLMVKAGKPVDAVISQLIPLLEDGDIVIDGGNSHYKDSARREEELSKRNLHFIGMGISGGEEGALNGPSMMPGGSQEAYRALAPILEPAAAEDRLGSKCVTHIGPSGSGHFVKMVHNGIEYAIMQLIAEIYHLLKIVGDFSNEELSTFFSQQNEAQNSFLLEISSKIFSKKEEGSKLDLIDLIKDTAKQKGTGKWTSIAAFDYGVSTPTINAAVDARIISGDHKLRGHRSSLPVTQINSPEFNKEKLAKMAAAALEICSLSSYAQGFNLIKKADQEYSWKLNLSEIARIWRGGCIIRSNYLDLFQKAYNTTESERKNGKQNLISKLEGEAQRRWRELLQIANAYAIPTPCLSASLSYYDSLHQEKLPQNLTQAQRDFFGAHTYQRLDKEGIFHTDWEV